MNSQIDQLLMRLRRDPNDTQAYAALKNLYRQSGDLLSLANLIENWAARARAFDRMAASSAFQEAAEVVLQGIKDPWRAKGLYAQALQTNPLNQQAAEGLQWLLESLGEYDQLAEYLKNQVRILEASRSDKKYIALLEFRLGELWKKRFQRSDVALKYYLDAAELDPTMLAAIFEAREIYLANGDLANAAELYDKEAQAESNVERKVLLLTESAHLRGEQLNDIEGAIKALRAALSSAPEHSALTNELAGYLIKRAETKDQDGAEADYRRAAELYCRLACSEPDQSAIQYLTAALDCAPYHDAALESLEQIAQRLNQEEILPGYWVRYLASASEDPQADQRRLRLAQAYMDTEQWEDAIFCLEPAAKRGHPKAQKILAELLRNLGRTVPGIDLNALAASVAAGDSQPPAPEAREPTQETKPKSELAKRLKARRSAEHIPDLEDDAFELLQEPETEPPLGEDELELSKEILGHVLKERKTFRRAVQPSESQEEYGAPPEKAAEETEPTDIFGDLMKIDASAETGQVRAEIKPPDKPAAASGKEPKEYYELAEPTAQFEAPLEMFNLPDDVPREDKTPISVIPPPLLEKAKKAQGDSEPPPAEARPAEDKGLIAGAVFMEPEPAPLEARPDADKAPLPGAVPVDQARTSLQSAIADNRLGQAAVYANEILAVDPADPEAFGFLERHYQNIRDYKKLRDLLLSSTRVVGFPLETRKIRLKEAAGISEIKLRDTEGAIDAWRSVVALDPADREANRALRQLLQAAKRWEELIQILEREALSIMDAAPRAALVRQIAQIHRDKTKDIAEEISAWQQVYALKPDDAETLDEFYNALLRGERYPEAIDLLNEQMEKASDKSLKLAYLNKLSVLYEQKLQDQGGAYGVYQKILEIAPDEAETMKNLLRLDEQSGRFDRTLAFLERQAASASGSERARLLTRMAIIAEQKLSDIEKSRQYLSEALELEPQSSETFATLSSLLERAKKYDELAELLRTRAVSERDPEARVELYRRIAHLMSEVLQNEEGAAEAWRNLLAIRDDREALEFMRWLAIDNDDVEQLARILKSLAALEPDAPEKRDLLFEYSRLLSARLERRNEAIEVLQNIVDEVDPAFKPAVDELAAVAEDAKDWKALTSVLEKALAATEDPRHRAELSRRLFDIYRKQLDDPKRAAKALQNWAKADPDNPEPFRHLRDRLEQGRRWKELIQVLDALARLEPDALERNRVALRSVDVALGKLNDADGAWHRLVPLVEQGVVAADRVIGGLALKTDRMEDLCRIYEKAGRYDELVKLLYEQAARLDKVDAQAELYRRIALITTDYLQDETGATKAWNSLLSIKEDRDALEYLRWQAVKHNDNERLADILKRLAALETDVNERRDLLYDYARLLNVRLERHKEAIEALHTILEELDPDFEPAIEELVAACEVTGDRAALAEALERQLAVDKRKDTRIELAAELAEIYQSADLKNLPRAVQVLQLWSGEEPRNPEPYRRLKNIFEETRQFTELIGVLDKLAELEPDIGLKQKAALRAVEIVDREAHDADDAWNRLSKLVDQQVEGADKMLAALAAQIDREEALTDILERAGKYEELASTLRKWASKEHDPEAQAKIYRRLAYVMTDWLQDRQGAKQAWQGLLNIKEDVEALEFMRRDALQRQDAEQLAYILERLAKLETEPGERRDLLFEYATVLNRRLNRAAEAIKVLRQIVNEIDAAFKPAVDELFSACEATGDKAGLADALEKQLALEQDAGAIAELAPRLAEIYEVELKDAERAISVLQRWASADASNPDPHRGLARLLEKKEHWPELLASLDALTALERENDAREKAALQAANIAYKKLRDPAGAWNRLTLLVGQGVKAADEAVIALASDTGRLEALCELFESAHRYRHLVALLSQQAAKESEADKRAELYRRIAIIMTEWLQDEEGAEQAWRSLLEIQEDHEALEFMRMQASKRDDPEQQADVAIRLAAIEPDLVERRDLLLDGAHLLTSRLGRPREAIKLLTQIVDEVQPGYQPALEELIAACEAIGDPAALAGALERLLAWTEDAVVRSGLAQRLAEMYQHDLNDIPKAIHALEHWSNSDPTNPEPHRFLKGFFEKEKRWEELLIALDALAELEPEAEARNLNSVEAAELSYTQFKDADGAWKRLAPLVQKGDAKADEVAYKLAREAGWGEHLANIYVTLAQQTENPSAAAKYWERAAFILEEYLGQIERAFEATLRKFATDLNNRVFLAEVDRLAIKLQAWSRLSQVYGRLIKQAKESKETVELLLRHADILDNKMKNPSAALDQVMAACRMDPENDSCLDRAEDLCLRLNDHPNLLWIYEHRGFNADTDEARINWLLRAAQTASDKMQDREQANEYIKKALRVTEFSPGLAETIEKAAVAMDKSRPGEDVQDTRRALVESYKDLATLADPAFASALLQRAAHVLSVEIKDDNAAFDVLRQGMNRFPNDKDIYAACENIANKIGRFDALDALLSRLIKQVENRENLADLLERRARLLRERLQRHDEAANVYIKLLEIDPSNAEASSSLRRCLEKAGRYLELVRHLEKQAEKIDDRVAKVSMLKEIAHVWEEQIINRWEAAEVWNRILAIDPDNSAAKTAVERLAKQSPTSLRPAPPASDPNRS